MAGYKAPDFQERAASARDARQRALDKLKSKPAPDAETIAARQAARERKEAAEAEKRAARREAIEAEKAAKEAAREKAQGRRVRRSGHINLCAIGGGQR